MNRSPQGITLLPPLSVSRPFDTCCDGMRASLYTTTTVQYGGVCGMGAVLGLQHHVIKTRKHVPLSQRFPHRLLFRVGPIIPCLSVSQCAYE
jgi:hypothetical protein